MSRFKADHRIAPNLLLQDEVADLVREATADVKAAAEALAPHQMAGTFSAEMHRDRTRHYGRVRTDYPGWLAVEVGTRRSAAWAPLRRGIEAAGLEQVNPA